MKKIIFLSILFLLVACGPSDEEKQNIAIITCNIMGESRNMDGAERIKEINSARDKINAESYLYGDDKIKEAFKYNICINLVLDDPEYENILLELKEKERKEREAEREAERLKKEQEAAAERLKKEQEAAAKQPAKKEWRAAIQRNLQTIEISYAYAYVKDNESVRIDIGATCQPGIRMEFTVKFKSIIPDLPFTSYGTCSDNSKYFYRTYSRTLRDYEIYKQIYMLPTIREDTSSDIKDLRMYIVQDIDMLVFGIRNPKNKDMDPRNYPPLEKDDYLNREEAISMKAKFSDRFDDFK